MTPMNDDAETTTSSRFDREMNIGQNRFDLAENSGNALGGPIAISFLPLFTKRFRYLGLGGGG